MSLCVATIVTRAIFTYKQIMLLIDNKLRNHTKIFFGRPWASYTVYELGGITHSATTAHTSLLPTPCYGKYFNCKYKPL